MSAEMYDPSTARFLSKDPLEEKGGPPVRYLTKIPNVTTSANPNSYLYCANDPVNKTDPSGNEVFSIDENKALHELLDKHGIGYTAHNFVQGKGEGRGTDFLGTFPPGIHQPYLRLHVTIIDAKDLDKARNIK